MAATRGDGLSEEDLRRKLVNGRELLLSCWNQFAYDNGKQGGQRRLHDGGLSTLEELNEALTSLGLINSWGRPKWDAMKRMREDMTQ